MITLETDAIILRSLSKRDVVRDCSLSAAVFDYGDREGCFAVVKKATREVIGVVLCPGEELTVEIIPAERDLGYGGEALVLGLFALFGMIGRSRVSAVCDEQNIPAIKTCHRGGLVKVSGEKGRIFWRLTLAEWELL